jgi:hypothetical protein
MKRELEALLGAKGYRHAAVLGPFVGQAGEDEYTVTLGDSRRPATERGTYAALRDWIAALPARTAPPPAGAVGLGTPDLAALLLTKNYPHALILGPFESRAGPPEYTAMLDGRGGPGVTQRGTLPQLKDWIAGLPQGPTQGRGRRRKPTWGL